MRIRIISIAILLVFLVGSVQADLVTPSHLCSKPYKPDKFSSEQEIKMFQYAVKNYEACIRDFIEEQKRAIRKHQNAAQQAIDEWNNFVNYELR